MKAGGDFLIFLKKKFRLWVGLDAKTVFLRIKVFYTRNSFTLNQMISMKRGDAVDAEFWN